VKQVLYFLDKEVHVYFIWFLLYFVRIALHEYWWWDSRDHSRVSFADGGSVTTLAYVWVIGGQNNHCFTITLLSNYYLINDRLNLRCMGTLRPHSFRWD
jgi:hypothetical protein